MEQVGNQGPGPKGDIEDIPPSVPLRGESMVSPLLLPGPSNFQPDYVVTQDHLLPAGPPNPQGHFVPSGCPGPSTTRGPGHGRPHSQVLQVGRQMPPWEPGGAWWGPNTKVPRWEPESSSSSLVRRLAGSTEGRPPLCAVN